MQDQFWSCFFFSGYFYLCYAKSPDFVGFDIIDPNFSKFSITHLLIGTVTKSGDFADRGIK